MRLFEDSSQPDAKHDAAIAGANAPVQALRPDARPADVVSRKDRRESLCPDRRTLIATATNTKRRFGLLLPGR
jgi:hypothetical protein